LFSATVKKKKPEIPENDYARDVRIKFASSRIAAVERIFGWFNNLGARRIPLNRSDIDRHFTSDLKLVIDMKVMAGGLDAMSQRMTEMLSKTEWWSVAPLPFEMALSENDLASAYYQYRFVDNEKQAGKIHIIAIWKVRDGKIAEVKELTQIEHGHIELQQY
jgi:hypothetical protein